MLNFESIGIGVAAFMIIGVFHPIVIKCEYHFSYRIWPLFLISGGALLITSLYTTGFVSNLSALVCVTCLWSIKELKEQAERVTKGWFPKKQPKKY